MEIVYQISWKSNRPSTHWCLVASRSKDGRVLHIRRCFLLSLRKERL